MNTKRAIINSITIGLIIILVAVLLIRYGPREALTTVNEEGEVIQLADVEIKEYEGKDLSSINAFRENSIKGPQYVNEDSYMLEITGLVDNPQSLSYEEVIDRQTYEKVVTLYCVEGWEATILWKGILVKDLIGLAGAKPDANTVIFHAYDGYTSSLPLEYVIENNIMMAYEMNNVTLPPERGFPFQLVAEDKWGYKWVKWISKIELSDDPEYRGYWELRGYSNTANLDEGYFD
jgi:DMSO/TMAO reductase YedYZ molybdopterin-dependent catalytic subunit